MCLSVMLPCTASTLLSSTNYATVTAMFARLSAACVLLAVSLAGLAEDVEDRTWHLESPTDGAEGTSTLLAEQTWVLADPAEPIIVAVIDTGIDLDHPALVGQLWINEAERDGKPGIDDDGNGYVDDVHGWNFLSNSAGEQVHAIRYEVTRELARMRSKADRSEADDVYLAELESAYADETSEVRTALRTMLTQRAIAAHADELLAELGEEADTAHTNRSLRRHVVRDLETFIKPIVTAPTFEEEWQHYQTAIDISYNLAFDEHALIGDNPDEIDEHGYGHPNVDTGSAASHGTHVSGIIAAQPIDSETDRGQAPHARIMTLVAVPGDGDERDKDVANAVRYAVDNGARIINMSFGKPYSPHLEAVQAAFAHAAAKGVLVVHAAGNDGVDIIEEPSYPIAVTQEQRFPNWLEVGASGPKANRRLPAPFSNYHPEAVDLFAPGHPIRSTVPDGEWDAFSGTSMAAPQVAGVAAIVLGQFPELDGATLAAIIRDSARQYPELQVVPPGGGKRVAFSSLSRAGGILDTLRALELAAERSGRPLTRRKSADSGE